MSEIAKENQLRDVAEAIEQKAESPFEPFYSLTASRDVQTIKRMIRVKYSFEVTDRYASDLIDFVEALTDGQ